MAENVMFSKQRDGEVKCPVCSALMTMPCHFVRHLYSHLRTDEHYYYTCPFDDCAYRALRISAIKKHLGSVKHSVDWTDDMVRNSRECTCLVYTPLSRRTRSLSRRTWTATMRCAVTNSVIDARLNALQRPLALVLFKKPLFIAFLNSHCLLTL